MYYLIYNKMSLASKTIQDWLKLDNINLSQSL